MKRSEAQASIEHNIEEPSEKIAEAKIENQSASEEWQDGLSQVDKLMQQPGEGTKQQPSEPKGEE